MSVTEIGSRRRGRSPGSIEKKKRFDALKAENEQLRSALTHSRTLEEWMELPEGLRDDFAARSLYESFGAHHKALIRLGFALPQSSQSPQEQAHYKGLCVAVFGTPGVMQRLGRTFEDAEKNRKDVMTRMTQIALSSNDESAVRAASVLAKYTGDDPATKQTNIYLWAAVAGHAELEKRQVPPALVPPPKELKRVRPEPQTIDADDPMSILGHDPGKPVRVIDDADDAAQGAYVDP